MSKRIRLSEEADALRKAVEERRHEKFDHSDDVQGA